MIESESSSTDRYRQGYREGFDDGYSRAEEQADKRRDEAEKKAGSDKGGDKKGDDEKSEAGEEQKEGDGKEEGKDDGKPPLYKRPFVVAGVLLLVLALVIAAIVFWRHSRHHESTDDAFIDGQTSQIAAQTAGRVTRLYVTDNQVVKAGEPLLDIDSRDTDARVTQSRAQLVNAQSQVAQAEAQVGVQRASVAEADAAIKQYESELLKASQDAARYRVVDPDAVPRQEADAAESAVRTARAKLESSRASARSARAQVEAVLAQVRGAQASVEASRASLASAELQGSYTHVVAPVAGRVTRRSVDVGNVVANGQALLALVSDSLWVTANFKETQLNRMQPGQSVEITVDAYPEVQFRGHVDSVQRATGAFFSMLPAENATGNYVKVVQRVPVKIVFDDDRIRNYVIGPGMSVSPNVSIP